MGISALQVATLRKKTGAGILNCKKVLEQCNGNMEQAIDLLREKGAKIAANRQDRISQEGVVIAQVDDNTSFGSIVELNCETDFVARSKEFLDFVQQLSQASVQSRVSDLKQLQALKINGISVHEQILDMTGKTGEKIALSNYKILEGKCVVAYIHSNYKLCVLVSLNDKSSQIIQAGKDIAMQIAAMNPIAIDKADISNEVKERELAIITSQVKKEGKPEAIAEKIALGKMEKFYKETTLLNQAFVKKNDVSVKDYLASIHPQLRINSFVRLALGT